MNNFDQIKLLSDKINALLLNIKDAKPNLYKEYTLIVDDAINSFIDLGAEYIENNPQEFKIFLKKLNDIITILEFIKKKENISEVKLTHILKQLLEEQKKKADRCKRIADRKYDKPSAYKSGAIVRCRQGKIWKDLKEIGDSSSQPYSFDYYGESDWGRIYGFDTENYPYTVEIIPNDENPNEVSIRFYVPDKANPDIEDDVVVTNEGNLFKVMATVSNIIKKDIQNHPEVDTLIFAPSKKPGEINNISRLNLYLKYIKKENPNAIITKGLRPQDVKIILKETDNPQSGKAAPYGSGYARLKKIIQEIIQEDESLHKWFKRKGTPGKEGGWVDCNTCRDGKCKPCGRKEGEKRAKYPSCRPTPAQCKTKGKGKKWGKTK